ncbi:MAG: OprO/OprP family phosphate-selective porin, partial [Methylomonas sp.]
MKLTKLSLAMASVLGAGFNADAFALDLYVDTKTQQIFAEPGKGRVLLGEFQKVGEAAAAKPAESADLKAEIAQIKQDLALKNNEIKALDEHVNDQSHGVL